MAMNDKLAVGREFISREVKRSIQNTNYLCNHLFTEKKGFVDTNGATSINIPVVLGDASNFGYMAGDETSTYNLGVQNNTKRATFNYKYISNPCVVTLQELAEAGENSEAVMDVARLKFQNCADTTILQLSSAVYGSGGVNGDELEGLGSVTAAAGVAYGGINNNVAENANWTPNIFTQNAANFDNIAGAIAICNKHAVQGRDKIDLLVSKPEVRHAFANTQQPQQVYNQSELDAGFGSGDFIKIAGIKWYSDDYVPGTATAGVADNHLYLISLDNFKFYRRYGFGKRSPMDVDQVMPTQPLATTIENIVGNFVCGKRNVMGVFNALNV